MDNELLVPEEFTSPPLTIPTEKIPEMVVKCVEVLDQTVEVEFVPPLDLGDSLAYAEIEKRKITLPRDEHNVAQLLVHAFHELAHVWYTTPFSNLPCELDPKELKALGYLEDIRVDVLFCRHYPEFRWLFWKDNEWREPSEFIAGLAYSLWSPLEGDWSVALGCQKLEESGLLDELRRATYSAKSTEDLIPFAKRLALENWSSRYKG
jgi:hypothetical protein